MFEVGKKYEVVMIIGGDETTIFRAVEKYEHPLLKFEDIQPTQISVRFVPGPGPAGNEEAKGSTKDLGMTSLIPGEIINVTSPNFIRATRKD